MQDTAYEVQVGSKRSHADMEGATAVQHSTNKTQRRPPGLSYKKTLLQEWRQQQQLQQQPCSPAGAAADLLSHSINLGSMPTQEGSPAKSTQTALPCSLSSTPSSPDAEMLSTVQTTPEAAAAGAATAATIEAAAAAGAATAATTAAAAATAAIQAAKAAAATAAAAPPSPCMIKKRLREKYLQHLAAAAAETAAVRAAQLRCVSCSLQQAVLEYDTECADNCAHSWEAPSCCSSNGSVCWG